MPECKLCKKRVVKLTNSHIIPEWCYKTVYDSKHRFIDITDDNFNRLNISQKGIREHLFCEICDREKLSKWEKILKEELDDIAEEKSVRLEIKRLYQEDLYIKGINYNGFKKAILSILLRMSLSSYPYYNSYKLGLYEERLRKTLDADEDISDKSYPIVIHKIKFKGEYTKSLIRLYQGWLRFNGKFIAQRLTFYGFLIDVGISQKGIPDYFYKLSLKQNGEIYIPSYEITKIEKGDAIYRRFRDKDVRKFFNY